MAIILATSVFRHMLLQLSKRTNIPTDFSQLLPEGLAEAFGTLRMAKNVSGKGYPGVIKLVFLMVMLKDIGAFSTKGYRRRHTRYS